MSVYNRKMFKRNARNALNQQAGVPSFKNGGGVQTQIVPINVGANTMLSQPVKGGGGTIRTSVPAYSTFTSPLTNKTYRSRTPSGQGITSLQPFDIARRYIEGGRTVGYGDDDAISPGEYALLQASQNATLTGDFIQDPTNTRAGGILADISRPFAQAGMGTAGFIRGLGEQGLQYALSSPDGPGEDTFGGRVAGLKPAGLDDDYLASMGINVIDPDAYSAPIGPQPAPPPPKPIPGGPTYPQMRLPDGERDYLRRQEEAVRAMAKDDPTGQGMVFYDEQTGEYKPGMPTDIMEAQLEANFAERQAGAQQLEEQIRAAQEKRRAIDTITEAENAATAAEEAAAAESGETPPDGTDASEDPSETGSTGTVPATKEDIDKVINEGNEADQKAALDGFIKEFMDMAPDYEGADSGLVLAKIGFAMAAGKSPRAIENIASALEGGADMLIKDKAKKDEFNRQLKLSALQYGLQETGKLRAEDRIEARERRKTKDYVAGPNGVTYKGRTYGPNETVPVTIADIRDGKMPEGAMATATITALGNQAKANAALLKDALASKQISMTEYQSQLELYNSAVTTAITSEIGIGLLENAMIDTAEGKVTGITPAVKSMLNEGANFFGMDLGRDYQNLDEVRDAMRASLQDLVPVTLGAAQSANSISNRDVDFLIEAYFGAGALNGGRLTFVTQDPDVMVTRLQRAAGKMRDAQKGAFTQMNTVTNTLTPVFQPGTQTSAAAGLASETARLDQAGLGGQGTVSFTNIGVTRGDDGVLRFTN